MSTTSSQPFGDVLYIATLIDQIITGWTPEQLEQWGTTNPDSVEMVINDYGYGLITHPGFDAASATDQQLALDTFRSYWEDFGVYISTSSTINMLNDLSNTGLIDGLDAITDNLTDAAQLQIDPATWTIVIQNLVDSPYFNPNVTIDEATSQIREIMAGLADNPLSDIAYILDMNQLGYVLENISRNGQISMVDAITDNLSDEAQLLINPSIWTNIIQNVADTPYFNPSEVTFEDATTQIRDIMSNLADNPLSDIAYILDMNQLGFVLENISRNGQISMIDAITDNLSDTAQTQIYSGIWTNIIQNIADAPFFNPMVTTTEAAAQIREIMADLADNPLSDIAYILDMNQLGFVLENISRNGDISMVDAITDNLSDTAQLQINAITWANIIQNIADAPFTSSLTVTPDMAAAQIRDIMADLNDNPLSDIAYIVDSVQLGFVMENASRNGFISIVDAITDNLSDTAQLQINPFSWTNTIQNIIDAPFFNPSDVTPEIAAMQVREIMTDLADNPLSDIAYILDMGALGYALENASRNGQVDVVDAVTDNLSDQAQILIYPTTWSNIIQNISDAPFTNPDVVTSEMATAQIREIMSGLADNSLSDIAYTVDASLLGFTMENAGYSGNIGLIDAITDNLSDTAQLFINPTTWGHIIQQVSEAHLIHSQNVTLDESIAQVREIMADLNDNPFSDIAYLVDGSQLGFAMENAGYSGNIGLIDAITDNLSDQAQQVISPATWGRIIQQTSDAHLIDPQNVTLNESVAQVREIMEGLADNQFSDIAYLVDGVTLDTIIQQSVYSNNFDMIDALVDSLSDTALSQINTAQYETDGVKIGTNAFDSLWDTAGEFEALYGLGGDDYVIGGTGNTSLYGGDGNDYVYDWIGGNDVLSGGNGSDFLYGGSGADTFVFNKGETGVDTLYAFNSLEGDRLDISNYLDQYDPTQNAIDNFVILTELNGNTTVSVDITGQNGTNGSNDLVVLQSSVGLNIDDIIDTTGIV